MMHELSEESGFALDELDLVQFTNDRVVQSAGNVQHPVPFSANTHNVGGGHFHSDLCYGFIATSESSSVVGSDESSDLRWLTLEELKAYESKGEALTDVVNIYEFLLGHIDSYVAVPAVSFSTEKPLNGGITYVRGAANEAAQRH